MRIRFFLIIFSVLTVVAVGATFLHGYLLHRERLELLDGQVREAATALLDSEINRARNLDLDRVEEILSEELGESRIGKFFVIRNAAGEILFENNSATLLPWREIPENPQWVTIQEKGMFLRVLNLKLPKIPDRTLQVGIVMEQSLLQPTYFSFTNLAFVGIIFVLGLGAAWGLTSTLMRPISRLVEFISGIVQDSALTLPPLPRGLARLAAHQRNDELSRLVDSFGHLLEKINRGQKLSRAWSYQMAHELKTPLAIAEGEITGAQRSGELGAERAGRLRAELMAASETVTAFLTWAELEASAGRPSLYAVSAEKTLSGLQQRLTARFGNRITLKVAQDFYVLAGVQHLEHLLLNLIQNALLYSPTETPVHVEIAQRRRIEIRDFGPGISPKVLERLGDPFNRGDHSPNGGHGLGLAYVSSVCKLYGWRIALHAADPGTCIVLEFPSNEDEESSHGERSKA